MPKTLVNEIDNTRGASSSSLTNTVYIPGDIARTITVGDVEYTFTSLASGHTESELLPHLLTSAAELDDLTEAFNATYSYTDTSGAEPVVLTKDEAVKPAHGMSFALAKYLLNSGCYVLFQIVVTDSETEWTKRFEELKDKGLYDVKFLCMGEFALTQTYKISDIKGCAERRGDCMALIDHPLDLSSVGESTDSYATKVHTWVTSNIDSSYEVSFSPWCSNTMYNSGTKASPSYPLLPPSFSFLASYANSIKSNPVWLSVAGAFRGAIPGLVKVGAKYGEKDIDILQNRVTTYSGGQESFGEGDNVGVACNPICNIEPFGIIIWGNRTGLVNGADGLKATSFLNVRNLACDIKKTMWKAARRYTFEQNTLRLWLNFCSQIRPLLDSAKTGEGIESYKFIQEETSAKGRLKARVIIVPIEAVEDFELSFVMDDTIETEESAG